MTLTNKQAAFVREYQVDFNATQAAIRAGYSEKTAYSQGQRLLKNVEVSAAIRENVMTADEVLTRLSDIARGDIGNVFDINTMGFVVDLDKAQQANKTKLIKKVKQRTTITNSGRADEETEIHDIEVELYSAYDALVTLGKFHKLFTDRTEVTGPNGGPQEIKITDDTGILRKLLPEVAPDGTTAPDQPTNEG